MSNPFRKYGQGSEQNLYDEQEDAQAADGAWGAAGAAARADVRNVQGFVPAPEPGPANGNGGAADRKATEEAAEARAADMREKDLQRRERVLAQREEELRRGGAKIVPAKNWPRCRPILYHSIRDEIPEQHKALVRVAYFTWLLSAAAFALNWVVILAMLAASVASTGWGDLFMATLVAVCGVPGAWVLWYRALYFATVTGKTRKYVRAFVFLAVHLAWAVWTVVGVPTLAEYAVGFFKMFSAFDGGGGKGVFFGLVALANVVVWGLVALLSVVLFGGASRALRMPAPAGGDAHSHISRDALERIEEATRRQMRAEAAV
ncbi:unnamed protein product [Pedinophyceae sp. YPF-701]|nr:unnamed protein product [Pedinophyceae sp. YPF-701]